eukprot:COSAG01_NODE_19437_length_1009_cov_1.445055_1_plen_97_part_00
MALTQDLPVDLDYEGVVRSSLHGPVAAPHRAFHRSGPNGHSAAIPQLAESIPAERKHLSVGCQQKRVVGARCDGDGSDGRRQHDCYWHKTLHTTSA